MDETVIVKRAMAGDETAFLQVLQIYENTMYRTAYAYLKNEHDAIEAVQEATYYRSLKKIHTLKEPSFVGTWLVLIYFAQYENYLQGEAEIEVPLQ